MANTMSLYQSGDYNQFEIFYGIIIALMPISKRYSPYIKNDIVRRKINQYTNWNILMILANSAMYHLFAVDNFIISRFIAINSFQIMTLFHLFMVYDSNVLFCVMDAEPFLLQHSVFRRIPNHHLVRAEYFVANIIVHILPVYFYRDYLVMNMDISMFHYIIMFKFMWVLNIFGDFNITSIYVPTFSGCNVKLVNLVVVIDFLTYKVLNYFL